MLEEERKFSNALGNLYVGIKEDEAAKYVSNETVAKFSKELAAQTLVTLLGCSLFDLNDKDIILCKRHLMAYHAKTAYQLKLNQQNIEIAKQNNRR